MTKVAILPIPTDRGAFSYHPILPVLEAVQFVFRAVEITWGRSGGLFFF